MATIASQARELLAAGLTVSQAAKQLGVPYMRVYMARDRKEPQGGSSSKSAVKNKKGHAPIAVQLNLSTTTFPSWWTVYEVDRNRYFARCPRSQFPHRTQQWFGIEAVIEEAAMITAEGYCNCNRTVLEDDV